MRNYSSIISLTKNSRGIYSLDPSIGCSSGVLNNPGGCYNDCYAFNAAKRYGYNFSNTVYRSFINENHKQSIRNKINNIKLDFIRMGTSGDPSENWDHTIDIIKSIDKCNKQIVVITKHWKNLSQNQLNYFSNINVCVNTSVSALDNYDVLQNGLNQYQILKKYCKSILRIVSADFNTYNEEGHRLFVIQNSLFENENTLDTVLRVSKNNPLVQKGIINISKINFLGKPVLASKFKKSTYFGKCSTCHEMCGINLKVKDKAYPNKKGTTKQMSLFKTKKN